MAVDAHFCVTLARDRCVAEDEIQSQFNTYREALLKNTQYYGAIIIRSDRGPDLVIDDEVWATVQNLCFLAAPDLIAGRVVEVPYFRYGSALILSPHGEDVVFSGEFIPTVSLPIKEVLPPLYQCGLRYTNLLRRLGEYEPNSSVMANNLLAQSEVARRAIEGQL